MSGMTVQDVLNEKKSKKSFTIKADTKLAEVVTKLNEYDVGLLVVLDGDKIQGVVSERDFIRKALSQKMNMDSTVVSEIMTKEVICSTPSEHLVESFNKFKTHKFRHLVVVDERGKLAGVFTERDITDLLLRNLKSKMS